MVLEHVNGKSRIKIRWLGDVAEPSRTGNPGLIFLNLQRVFGKIIDVIRRKSYFSPCIWETSE